MGGFVGGGSRAENEPVLDLNRSERERDRDLIVLRERGQRRSLPGARVCQQRLFLHALGGGRHTRVAGQWNNLPVSRCLSQEEEDGQKEKRVN